MLTLGEAWSLCAFILALGALFRGVENAIRFAEHPVALRVAGLSAVLAGWAGVGALQGEPVAAAWWMLCVLGSVESMRAHGLEQGGSDTMTLWLRALVALAATWPGLAFPLSVVAAGILLASYLCAGLGKARVLAWYNGRALAVYLRGAAYVPMARWSAQVPRWCLAFGGILVLAFELMAPAVLFNSGVLVAWVIFGIVFHLANILFFGLHRFFWAWLAAYPFLFSLVQG